MSLIPRTLAPDPSGPDDRPADPDATARHHGFMCEWVSDDGRSNGSGAIVLVLNLLLLLQIAGVPLSAFAAAG